MIELRKDVDISIPFRLETTAGVGVTGLTAALLTIKLANKDSADWEVLTPVTHYTVNELSEGDYTLTILAGVNDTYGHLRIKISDEDSSATAVTRQYTMGISRLADPVSSLTPAQVNIEVDTALAEYNGPTHAEMTSEHNVLEAEHVAISDQITTVDGIVDDILIDTGTTIPALIAALNNVSSAAVEAACDAALATYDGPTNAEMEARTLVTASYATAAVLSAVQTDLTIARKLRQNRLEFVLGGTAKAYIWNDAGSAREFETTLTDNAGGVVTAVTSGPINATAWTVI